MAKLTRFHWISGSDDFRRRRCMEAALRQEMPEEAADFNYDRLDGGSATSEQIATLATTPPLMSSRRLLRIDDAHELSRDATEQLLEVVEAAAKRQEQGHDDLALIVSQGVGRGLPPRIQHVAKKIKAFAQHDWTLDAFEDKERDWPKAIRWCQQYARDHLGVTVPHDAAERLTRALGITDTGRLAGEMEKLAHLAQDGTVGRDLVDSTVTEDYDRNLWALVDAVGGRNLAQATDILPEVLRQPDQSGVRISINLAYRLTKIGLALSLRAEGTPSSLLNKRVGYPARSILGQARSWSPKDVDHALSALLEADLALKSGGKEQEVLEDFLHEALTPIREQDAELIGTRGHPRR